MSQNDFTIANQGFPAFRADLNTALQALATNNSGATAPSTTFANMWWYETDTNIMYIRNEDNDAWIKFAELDQTNDKFVLSGTLQLDDGTVSAPALTFNSDTNMGLYRGGTDILKFVTAGADRVTIDATGYVGIGTASPSSSWVSANNLVISDTSSDGGMTIISGTSGNGNIMFSDATAGAFSDARGLISYIHASDAMRFMTANTERMRITSAGKVGIGTTSGTAPLEISNSATNSLRIHRDFATNSASSATIRFAGDDSAGNVTDYAEIRSLTEVVTNGSEAGALLFGTLSSGSVTERMRIDSSGNVGIGTSSPSAKIHVAGSGQQGIGIGSTNAGGAYLYLDGDSNGDLAGSDYSFIGHDTAGRLDIHQNSPSGTNQVRIFSAGTERMRISTNILIGTTDNSPAEGTGAGTRIGTNGGCQFSTSGIETARMNRTGDGNILVFAESGSVEGAIAVSGTTVSLNGGHLSRWSRLLDNSKDTSFVKGTVMTNLDEMVEWGDEDNSS